MTQGVPAGRCSPVWSDRFGHLAQRLVPTGSHKLIVWKDPDRRHEVYALATFPSVDTVLRAS